MDNVSIHKKSINMGPETLSLEGTKNSSMVWEFGHIGAYAPPYPDFMPLDLRLMHAYCNKWEY